MLSTRILICCPVTSEEVPFVYLASVCRSLQCLISTLTQAGRGGLSFKFTCSVVLQRGRGISGKCHWPLWGALAVFHHTGFAPGRSMCSPCIHCSGSRLLSREQALSCVHFPGLSRSNSGFWVLYKSTDSVGPTFCAFPCWSSSGSQELDERTVPSAVHLIPSRVPASVSRHASRVCLVSLMES